MKKNGKGLIFGAVVLTFAGIVAKAVGAVYKIPLTNILGSAGIGIYYLIFPIFSILLVICSSGVSIALIKCISGVAGVDSKSENMYFISALVLSTILSLIFATIMICFCKEISEAQGNINGYLGYVFIAPALVIASIIAIIRAYFQGIENMIPTSVSIIIEQVAKTIAGLVLAKALYGFGIEYAVLGAVAGVSISELVALVIMIINYVTYQKRLGQFRYVMLKERQNAFAGTQTKEKEKYRVCAGERESFGQAMLKIIKATIPNTLSQMILPLCSAIDAYLVINLMVRGGISTMTATILYGINYGIVTTVLGIAMIVINGLSTAIMPNISRLISTNSNDVEDKCAFFIKIVWCLSVVMTLMFILFGRNIIDILYGSAMSDAVLNETAIAGSLMIVSSITIIYYAMLSAFVTILQSIGRFYTPACVMCVAILARVALLVVLCKNSRINILGGVIAHVAFLAVSASVCAYFVKKNIDLSFSKYRMMVVPIFACVVSGGVGFLIKYSMRNVNAILGVMIASVITLMLYLFILIKLKCFNNKELKYVRIKKTR